MAKHFSDLKLNTSVGYTLFINKDTWNKLSPEDQEIFRQVGLEAEEQQILVWEGFEKKIRGSGAVDIHEFSDEDTAAWIKALPEVPADWAEKMEAQGHPGREIMKTYLDLHKQIGWKFPREWVVD